MKHKDEIREQNKEISSQKDEIREQNNVIGEQKKIIMEQTDKISTLDQTISDQSVQIDGQQKEIVGHKSQIDEQFTEIKTHLDALKKQENEIERLQREKDELDAQHEARVAEALSKSQNSSNDHEKELEATYKKQSDDLQAALEEAKNEYMEIGKSLDETEEVMNGLQEELEEEKRQHAMAKAELQKLKQAMGNA